VRVLLINDGDRGGSIVAMTRLHRGLQKAGVVSTILNRVNRSGSPDIVWIPQSRFCTKFESALWKLTSRVGLNDIHCISTFALSKLPAYRDADVLDFHTIHGGFFNYLALPRLTRTKPAVLTLHDMWFFTGHCSYSYDCERWKIGCGNCPHLDVYPAVRRDATRVEWKLKDWAYSRSNLAVVSPSRWLFERATQSILGRYPIYHIPHGLQMDIYRPLEAELCRSLLGIPRGKKVLLFTAMRMDPSAAHFYRKGCDLLVEALAGLPGSLKKELVLMLVGHGGERLAEAVGIEAVNLGYVESDQLKAVAYSASDLFVFPTRGDIFGLVLLESMACGTPIVSFAVGGVPELVRHGVTGHLAQPENVGELREGILCLLEDRMLRERMSRACREIAVREYPLELQVRRYVELYSALASRS
jgi:glycosyltransferase involved in cell wall biosynthesis